MFYKFLIKYESAINRFYERPCIKFFRTEIHVFWGRVRFMSAFLIALLVSSYKPYTLILSSKFLLAHPWSPLGIFFLIFYTLFLISTWVVADLVEASEEPETTPQVITKLPWFKPEDTPFEDFTYRVWHVCVIVALIGSFIFSPMAVPYKAFSLHYLIAWKCVGFVVGQGLLRLCLVIVTDTLAGRRWPLYKRFLRKFMGFIDT